MKDKTLIYRGSVSDLATDIKTILSPEEINKLANELLNIPHRFEPSKWSNGRACKICNTKKEYHN